jgi:uncharacterized protein (TIGR02996 family)
MDDGTALLAAIALYPDEDVPRLAYADWLDEHNSPVRAEFIRLQCEIHRIETDPAADARNFPSLYLRQKEFLANRRHDLLGPLGDEVTEAEMNTDIVFERGFLKELRLDGARFVKHADSIAGLKPLPDVTVENIDPAYSQLRRLPQASLDLVTSLELAMPALDAMGQVFDLLHETAPPTFPRLQSLHANYCGLGDDDLAGIVSGPTFPVMEVLSLAGNEISDDGVRLVVRSPSWPRLTMLVLDQNPISDEGAEVLANAPPTAIKYLNVRRTGIGQRGQQRLLRRGGWNVALF